MDACVTPPICYSLAHSPPCMHEQGYLVVKGSKACTFVPFKRLRQASCSYSYVCYEAQLCLPLTPEVEIVAVHVAGKAREKACLQTLTVLHVPGDPLQKDDLDTKIDMRRYCHNTCRTVCQFISAVTSPLWFSFRVSVHLN